MPDATPAPLLEYDRLPPRNDPTRRRIMLGYWLGLLLANVLNGIIAYGISRYGDDNSLFGAATDTLLNTCGWFILELFLGTLFLGLSIWIKARIVKDVRYAAVLTASSWGIIGGLVSPSIVQHLRDSPPLAVLALVSLAWHCLFPVIAGLFLCRRSHLRP